MSAGEVRELLARDVFVVDNYRQAPEASLQDWEMLVAAESRSLGYYYTIADSLIARGWGRAQ